MKIGLKRGTVELADHDPQWKVFADETINKLWDIFGSAAKGIEHVGSTSIKGIKAKPVIDIAVAVENFDDVSALSPALEEKGFICVGWESDGKIQPMYQCGEFVPGEKLPRILTHFIHIVISESQQWRDYINHRDYMNACPSAAHEYESLKLRLAQENKDNYQNYFLGKQNFILEAVQIARLWDYFGRKFIKIESINKGWSNDKKYYIETADEKRMLLRVSDISDTRKKIEYEMMKKVAELGVPMSRPIDFGTCNDGRSVYVLFSWIDGEDAEKSLPLMAETEQYVLGLKAGEYLKKIHSVPAPSDAEEWAARFNRKIDIKIKKYSECGLRFDGDDKIINYIEQNRSLLENRTQSFHHGDYHIGNMIISQDNTLYIIDWNRSDFGDPWEEFNRIIWCTQISPHFATGMVNGYFNCKPPMEFWKLLAFYIGSNTLSSIYWAVPYGQEEIEIMMKQSQEVLTWFDNMQNPVPAWYLKDFYIQWIDGVPYKLKVPFDFSFLSKYGKAFKVFDDQDSGNICFGMDDGVSRYFVKFAGAVTECANVSAEEAVANLKRTVPVYIDLAHQNLITFINAEEVGGGFSEIFLWADADCMGRQYPLSREKFLQMPIETRLQVFEDILSFHAHVVQQGYVAIDFYDGSIMYDFGNHRTVICDIDFYSKTPYINNMGRLWGSSRFMSPEEYQLKAIIDEITNVYTMGATAFALFGDERDRRIEKWRLDKKLFEVAKRAVSDERSERQQSIHQLIDEWRAAKENDTLIIRKEI